MNAYNMDANIPVLFRSYESHEPHSNCKIWEAARATSAAPNFFKRIEIGRAQPYIDGGLGRNNRDRRQYVCCTKHVQHTVPTRTTCCT